MKTRARLVAIVSLAVLVIDFFTLENRIVTTNPVAQVIGRVAGTLALIVFVCSTTFIIGGAVVRPRAVRATPPGEAGGAPSLRAPRPPGGGLRVVKLMTGLLVLALWFAGGPLYVYRNLIAKSPDFSPGPWIADAFLSAYAVGVQVAVPGLIALAFWPSALMAVYLVFSRKTRPVLDAVVAVSSLGLVLLIWYVITSGIQLGRPR